MPRLTVNVIEARNLRDSDWIGRSDPYVIVHLGGLRGRTTTIKGNLNPVWNQGFDFNTFNPSSDLVTFRVYDNDLLVDDPLGHTELSLSQLYQGTWMDMWLPLHGRGAFSKSGQVAAAATSMAPVFGSSYPANLGNVPMLHVQVLAHDFGLASGYPGPFISAPSNIQILPLTTESFFPATASGVITTAATTLPPVPLIHHASLPSQSVLVTEKIAEAVYPPAAGLVPAISTGISSAPIIGSGLSTGIAPSIGTGFSSGIVPGVSTGMSSFPAAASVAPVVSSGFGGSSFSSGLPSSAVPLAGMAAPLAGVAAPLAGGTVVGSTAPVGAYHQGGLSGAAQSLAQGVSGAASAIAHPQGFVQQPRQFP